MSETSGARSILIVDDDDALRERLVAAFTRRGYEATGAANFEEALTAVRRESPELATVDLRIPGGSGLDLVKEIKAVDPATNVIVMTGYGSIATALEAVRLGATHYVTKPADVDDLLTAFSRAEHPPEITPEAEGEVPSLARAEWEHINRVLSDCGGNVSKAARLLGIHRRSLQRKLSKYPVSR